MAEEKREGTQQGISTISPQQEEVTIPVEEYQNLQYWASQGQKKQSSFWTDALNNPEGTRALKEGVKEVIDSTMGSWAKLQKGDLTYSAVRMLFVVLLLGAIIGVASWLTSTGRLDGSGLIFLLGTITGYLLTFLAKVEHA